MTSVWKNRCSTGPFHGTNGTIGFVVVVTRLDCETMRVGGEAERAALPAQPDAIKAPSTISARTRIDVTESRGSSSKTVRRHE